MPKKMLSNSLNAVCVSCLLSISQLTIPAILQAEASLLSGMVYPVMAPKITSLFGMRTHPKLRVKKHHGGIDLAAPVDAPIRAIQAGKVVFADRYSAYGNLVVIMHPNGFTSHYGHCNSITAEIGQSVAAGEIIATVGSTGRSTGPHLHFELRRDGKTLNPETYLPALRAPAKG